MGSWYLSISISLVLMFIGLTTHWIVILFGVLMLFIPPLAMLLQHRRARLAQKQGRGQEESENNPQERQSHNQ